MITTRELLAPYGLGIYFVGQFFARPFCGNLFYFARLISGLLFLKTASPVLAERGKSEMEKVKEKLIPRTHPQLRWGSFKTPRTQG